MNCPLTLVEQYNIGDFHEINGYNVFPYFIVFFFAGLSFFLSEIFLLFLVAVNLVMIFSAQLQAKISKEEMKKAREKINRLDRELGEALNARYPVWAQMRAEYSQFAALFYVSRSGVVSPSREDEYSLNIRPLEELPAGANAVVHSPIWRKIDGVDKDGYEQLFILGRIYTVPKPKTI